MPNEPFHEPNRLSLAAVGAGLTASLLAVYIACALAAFLVPSLKASHA